MKVTAVVPVYNEEKTIKGVLEVLSSSKDIDEILVIDDGSTDKTPDIIKRLQANKMEYIKLKRNIGKDNAIRKCAKNINSEIVMIFDSDLIGFEKHHIENMLNALVEEKAGMVIGLRDKGNFLANLIMPYFPLPILVLFGGLVYFACLYLMKGFNFKEILDLFKREKIVLE